jgi:hypothetical protein
VEGTIGQVVLLDFFVGWVSLDLMAAPSIWCPKCPTVAMKSCPATSGNKGHRFQCPACGKIALFAFQPGARRAYRARLFTSRVKQPS